MYVGCGGGHPDGAVAAEGADFEDVLGTGHADLEGEVFALAGVAGDVGKAGGEGVVVGVFEGGVVGGLGGGEEVYCGESVDGGGARGLFEGGGVGEFR